MEIEEFNMLKRIAEKELVFDEKQAEKVGINTAAMYQRYLDIYIKEQIILKEKKINLDDMYGTLYKHMKYKDQYEWGAKAEIDSQINTNIDYKQLRIEIARQEAIVEYLSSVLDNVKRLSYTFKNWVDYKKFVAGMY